MRIGPWTTKTKDVSKGNRNIGNFGSEGLQSDDKMRDISIADVVNDDEDNNNKDDELYNDNNHKIREGTDIITLRGDENDLEGVCQSFKGADNGKSTKQHNSELDGSENPDNMGDDSSFKNINKNQTDITTITTIDEEDDPGFV